MSFLKYRDLHLGNIKYAVEPAVLRTPHTATSFGLAYQRKVPKHRDRF